MINYYNKYDDVINNSLTEYEIPGLSMAIINKSKVYSKSYGFKNINKSETVNNRTIFECASLTKPIVAYIALKLSEESVINLNIPLHKYLKTPYIESQPLYELITATNVLAHSTGFPNWRRGKTLTVEFTPGQKFQYSGEGYVYLQKVLEELSGRKLSQLAKEYVFTPFNMKDSSLVWLNEFEHNYAYGHNENYKPVDIYKTKTANAAYSLYSTAEDYSKFILAMLNVRKYLKGPLSSKMLSCITPIAPNACWGLGWGIEEMPDKICWHWGDNGGFKAVTGFKPKEHKGIVILTNGSRGLHACRDILHVAFGECEGFNEIIKMFYS